MAKEYVYVRKMKDSKYAYLYERYHGQTKGDEARKLDDILHKNGRVFLNDALEHFGYDKIPAGQCVGWDHGNVSVSWNWREETITFRCEEILSRWIKEVEKK